MELSLGMEVSLLPGFAWVEGSLVVRGLSDMIIMAESAVVAPVLDAHRSHGSRSFHPSAHSPRRIHLG